MKVLKFYADWCQPCKMLSKSIESVKDKLNLQIEEVDIDANMDLAKQYNVRGVPALIVVDESGGVIRSKSGYMNDNQLLEFVNG